MVTLNFKYDSISDFYKHSDIVTKEGDKERHEKESLTDSPLFRGLDTATILNSKYCYKSGIDAIKNIELTSNIGGSAIKYKYDETDGDDMNYDRMLDGFPAMLKRVRKKGYGTGKFVDIYINISENCNIDYSKMINKAHAAIQLIDFLEKNGFRVAVYSCDYTNDPSGTYKGQTGVQYSLEVCLKKHEDSLNLGLILTGVSPWFFRYHMFKHQIASYNPSVDLGQSIPCNKKEDGYNIIIDKGECLSEESAKSKIEQVLKNYTHFE